jgi:glucose/arabinose dehydrogenase
MGRVTRARTAARAGVGIGVISALLVFASALLVFAPAAARAQSCPGDCGGDGEVAIDDLIKGVGIALGNQPVGNCAAMDGDGDGRVEIQELVRAVAMALEGCEAEPTATAGGSGTATVTTPPTTTTPGDLTVTPTATPPVTPPTGTATDTPGSMTPVPFCSLPGSVQSTGPGLAVVPGGAPGPDLSFINLPIGFCVHYYGNVRNTRQMRFSPSGDLFVASPSKFSTSNGQGGRASIVVLPDDDGDGRADETLIYRTYEPSQRPCERNQDCPPDGQCRDDDRCEYPLTETVGLLFHDDHLYYQDKKRIMRIPFAPGDREPSGDSEEVANLTHHVSFLHWPKAIDAADDGTIYVTNGGDETDPCPLPASKSYMGAILKLDGDPAGTLVAKGFRNPISVRCVRGHNKCFAIELTRDYSTPQGGREKLLPVRDGDDWGFPCCATKNLPYEDRPGPNCSGVAEEINSFFVGNTPFDLDFELGKWPEPWGNRAYVPIHGAYGSWAGARLVGVELDAMTGQVLPGSDLSGMSSGAMADFATGWDPTIAPDENPCKPNGRCGRPTVVAFAPDGRLFMGNDFNGDIIWIAPVGLAPSEDE